MHFLHYDAIAVDPHHFDAFAGYIHETHATRPGQLVVDIGCNDGLLLAAALGVAMLLNFKSKGTAFFRSAFYFP